ncbi:MAG: polysaccharide biosynthesis/export family protein [Burkholderiales bacterium]|nr:polysaccharide biosynthesis/export family protein [Flavobacterium sp.]
MNKIILLILVGVGLISTSCVPTKDLIYLQNKDQSDLSAAVNPVVAKPYRLQMNDIISITIKAIDPKLVAIFSPSNNGGEVGKSESSLYFDGFTVDDHGNIRMPVLGEINVIGYTLDELRLTIEKKLSEEYFNKEANIFVTVKLAGLRYTINGEIASPGTKTLFQEKVNILEAVANSGDITITGDRKAVTVMRQFPQGMEMHDIDLTDIKALQSPYFYIQPNDYIYVKPLKQKSWGTGKTGIESLTSIITVLTLITTTFLLLKK